LQADLATLENRMEQQHKNIRTERENIELEQENGNYKAVASSEEWISRYSAEYARLENEALALKVDIIHRGGSL